MARSDVRQRVLGVPHAFELFQTLVGASESKAHFIRDHVRAGPTDHVLDLGCGTGALLQLLPSGLSYVGVDVEPGYIERANTKFRGAAQFVCADITRYEPAQSSFDLVIAYGVLHHLDDEGVRAANRSARRALRTGGRVLFAEPCWRTGQGRVETWIMRRDRGGYVRTTERYLDLLRPCWPRVSATLAADVYRIPYTLVILEGTR